MSSVLRRRATYQDVLDAPETKVAEIVDGELTLSPRPAGPHANTTTLLGTMLGAHHDHRFRSGGGWAFLDEPELHLGENVVVPDLAAWREENRPASIEVAFFEHAPDFVCETLSPSTTRFDRVEKLPVYARAGVTHVWFVDPSARTLEVMRLDGETYRIVMTAGGTDVAAAPPFEEMPLELARLWTW